MLTNRLGLPQAIVDAVTNDPYTKGESDISVTQLIQPPYQRKLRVENEVVEDVSDRIWSLVGQVGHSILERSHPEHYAESQHWVMRAALREAGIEEAVGEQYKRVGMYWPERRLSPAEYQAKHGVVIERRLFMKINGWTVSGQFDLVEGMKLMDYKFTSVWSVKGETKTDWVNQLNLLRLLAIHNGMSVIHLGIMAILRDWSKGKSKQGDYPDHQIAPVEIPVWSLDQAEAYLLERVKLHQAADPLPCTDEERWKRDDVFAVMKLGNKRAVKLFDRRGDADALVSELGPTKHSVQTRPGEFLRCMEYCNVAHVCPQMATEVGF
jgi:hypothetical protein